MIKYLKLLLWPFSILYGAIMAIRNFNYEVGLFKSKRFDIPVIAVGNLTVGGTGKTPHVEYLICLLSKYNLATLSRGYKRKTKGFILATEQTKVEEIGDEPFQYHQDFESVKVAVSEKRVQGVEQLLSNYPDLNIVLLDDAFQHLSISPSLNLMLTDFNRLFYNDYVLPAGLLREFRSGAKRADIIVVSKCPKDLSSQDMDHLRLKINKYTSHKTKIFFSTFDYGQPIAVGNTLKIEKEIVLLSGIANPAPLRHYLQSDYRILKEFIYPDHYAYTPQDLLKVKGYIDSNKTRNISVVTTRKDVAKFNNESFKDILNDMPVFYIPIEVKFIQDADFFDSVILEHITNFRTS